MWKKIKDWFKIKKTVDVKVVIDDKHMEKSFNVRIRPEDYEFIHQQLVFDTDKKGFNKFI